ncbi:MAG: peptidoglycan-binding protein [Candidatus Omnitrophica bacterium]|nr:peptidoglycan-binding protein [Candidatus Omnitrophota bacterium]
MIRIVWLLLFAFILSACSREQEPLEQMQEPLSVELPTEIESTLPVISVEELELPQAYKPTNKEIQAALRSAGFYTGKIDGDIGPMTKRAIEDFQAANDLAVDGVIGPKTWAILGQYLIGEQED